MNALVHTTALVCISSSILHGFSFWLIYCWVFVFLCLLVRMNTCSLELSSERHFASFKLWDYNSNKIRFDPGNIYDSNIEVFLKLKKMLICLSCLYDGLPLTISSFAVSTNRFPELGRYTLFPLRLIYNSRLKFNLFLTSLSDLNLQTRFGLADV